MCVASSPSWGTTLVVGTDSGPVVGFEDVASSSSVGAGGQSKETGFPIRKWLGIPFAQAERWKRPQRPNSWLTPRECLEYGPAFPQGLDPFFSIYDGVANYRARPAVIQSEAEGFNLNIYVPGRLDASDRLPVLVWFHGGALVCGNSSFKVYDPTEWIRREAEKGRKAIIVTGNYRLHILGFMACRDLVEEDEDGLAGNYGLYDCLAILRWVQSNIENFGGNPDNVTIFGESAGGFLVSCLLVTQEKLFRRAVMQSGFPGSMVCRKPEQLGTNQIYQNMLDRYSQPGLGRDERLALLRRLPLEEMMSFMATQESSLDNYGLAIEEASSATAIWTNQIIQLLQQGRWNPNLDSLIMGTVKDEGSMLASVLHMSQDNAFAEFRRVFTCLTSRETLERLYPSSYRSLEFPHDSSILDPKLKARAALVTHRIFQAPMEHLAAIISTSKNWKTSLGCKIFMYSIEGTIKSISEKTSWGAFHTVDVPFLFNTSGLWHDDPDSYEAQISAQMGYFWYTFAQTSYPGKWLVDTEMISNSDCQDLPKENELSSPSQVWPEFFQGTRVRILLGKELGGKVFHSWDMLDDRPHDEVALIRYWIEQFEKPELL